jgi:hypothetical protein
MAWPITTIITDNSKNNINNNKSEKTKTNKLFLVGLINFFQALFQE